MEAVQKEYSLKFCQIFNAWSVSVYYVNITKTAAISSSKVQSLNWHQYESCPFQESLEQIWGWSTYKRLHLTAFICFSLEYDWTTLNPCVLFCVSASSKTEGSRLLFLQAIFMYVRWVVTRVKRFCGNMFAC